MCTAAGSLFGVCALAQQIAFTIERIDGPSVEASKITVVLRAAAVTMLELQVGEIKIAGNHWRNVRIHCPELIQERHDLVCARGVLETPARIPLSLRYSTLTKKLDLALRPALGEEWRFTLESRGALRTVTLVVSNGLASRFAAWWPQNWPTPNAGSMSGKLVFGNGPDTRAEVELTLADVGFGDASGLHAGEKISAVLSLHARKLNARWQWQSRLEWKSGDVFWQPWFIAGGGQALSAAGTLDEQQLMLERGRFAVAGVGDFELRGALDRVSGKLTNASLKSANLEVAAFCDKLLKPILQGTAFNDLRCGGRADISFDVKAGAVTSADLVLKRISIEDGARRFALFGIDGKLPWDREQLTSARLRLDGGEVLNVPFGAFELPLEMRGIRVRTHDVRIPVLDGMLLINDFATSGERESWRWRFRGGITPVSMQRFTTALGLPAMHGTLSAVIPAVSYQKSILKVDGELLFKVFDGAIVMRDLALESPLGKTPRLTADIDMSNLDLDLLTRTFSFGNITGRIDARVKALELVNWEAVRFDARLASSAGEYPRHISQTAVQNISTLGGAGAASAIQRSFLRFFENFGYSALGLSCKLENGVCRMGGIEDVSHGYAIVKGGGIPAITVLGYNREVGWRELIERLKRVTQGNVIVN